MMPHKLISGILTRMIEISCLSALPLYGYPHFLKKDYLRLINFNIYLCQFMFFSSPIHIQSALK